MLANFAFAVGLYSHYFFDYFEKFPKSILHKFRRYVLSLQ
jgi:hypothetical protein